MDPSQCLLDCIDQATLDEYSFNGSVLRRALKAMVNENFAHSNWEAMVTTTKAKIMERFIVDSDGISAEQYYQILCNQVLQKALRTATQKFRPKESYHHNSS